MNKKIFISIGILLVFFGYRSYLCMEKNSSDSNKQSEKKERNLNIENRIQSKETKMYKIESDKIKISKYTIEDTKIGNTKTIIGKMSNYTTKELEQLPNSKRLTLHIVVPYNISKESLQNTLKSIVVKKTEKDNNIDEMVIFAYDDKNDIGNGYTFGKLLWAPNGKTGLITPEIVLNKDRSSYKFEIILKKKVGNIKKADLPTKRELEIYNEVMSEKYWDMQEEDMEEMVMKKFNIKSKKEFDRIFLKVGAYKLF